MTPHMVAPTLSVVLAVMLVGLTAEAAGAEGGPDELKVFSGESRLIVVNGYSTSFHWWAFLQRKINRYMPGDRVVEVRPATRGGTPIARWMNVETGQPREPWTQTLRPALQAKGDRPAVVLCQQSLQWVFGEQREGIRSADDTDRIKGGADALEKYVRLLLEDGADAVFVATHIYKEPMEPEIGNERLALAELMTREVPNVFAGPDVWEPTRTHYPKAFARDRRHPNSIGAEVMAQMWFETLLKYDGLGVPEWSKEEMVQAIEKEPVELGGDGFQRLLQQWRISPSGRRRSLPAGDWGQVSVGHRETVLENSVMYVRYGRYRRGDDKDAIVDLVIKDAEENWGAKIDSRARDDKLVKTAVAYDGTDRKTVRLEYERGTTQEVSIFPNSPVLEIAYLTHDVNIFDQSHFTGEWVIFGAEEWLKARKALGPMDHLPENERPVKNGLYPGYPDSYYRKSWAVADPLDYHGSYIVGLYNPERGTGYGRVMPVEHVDVIKLLFDPVKKPNLGKRGFELFPHWIPRRDHQPFTGYLFVVTGGAEEVISLGKQIADGQLPGKGSQGSPRPALR